MFANHGNSELQTAKRRSGLFPPNGDKFNVMLTSPSQFFETLRYYHSTVDEKFEQPEMITTKLRAYQRRAVKWMINREKNNNLVKSDGSAFSGGILADEMGLGKTIEMLCCIMANPSPPEFHIKKIEFADSKDDTQNISIPTTSKTSTSKYTSTKSKKQTVKNTMDDDNLTIECCINTPSDKALVVCAACGKTQHANFVHFNPKLFHEVPFLCANCWTFTDIIQCKATLIVVPQCVMNQWIQEIQKHIKKPGFNVLIYNGMLLDGCYQQISFNNYDVVIMTYTTLLNDVYYVGNNLKNGRTPCLKHSKRCNPTNLIIDHIKWWRVCFNECPAFKFKLVTSLQSVHRWSMTSIPARKSVEELYNHLHFLDVSPYCDREQFSLLMKGEADLVYKWFSQIIWRNSVDDINSKFNLPIVTTENHWLTFSDIEKYFYVRKRKEYSDCLVEYNAHIIPEIADKMKQLRQACIHPQDFSGQFVKVKTTMTMEKYVDEMIEKCRVECNDLLHSLVSKHHTIAGIYNMQSKYTSANSHYSNISSLRDEYRKKNIHVIKDVDNYLQSQTDSDGPPEKKIKWNNIVNAQKKFLKTDIPLSEESLKKKTAILLYYENLKREPVMSSETECEICSFNFGSQWAVLQCGHSLCKKCLATICINSGKFDIHCPFCRSQMTLDSLNYVKSNQEEGSNIEMKGLFSTKIGNITKKLMELIVQDPKVKVLIFSTWEKTLHILGEALEQNSVNFRILKNRKNTKYNETLNDFKTNVNINALLMQWSLVSKELNLTEATRVFFMEPIISKADEDQAISCIHRPGQTKPTFVHNFIIRESVEEEISTIQVKWYNITRLTPRFCRIYETSQFIQPYNGFNDGL